MPQPGPTPGTTILTPDEAATGGYTLNEYGFYQDADGTLAPGQVTQGQRDNPGATNYYDAARDLDYTIRNGKRVYQSPVSYDMTQDRPTPQYRTSKSGAPITDTGGGAVHSFPHWNQDKGKWDIPLDWSKIGGYAVAGGIAAPYIIGAVAGAGAGGAGAGAGAGTLPSSTLAGSSTLGGGMTAGASGGIAAAPSGLLSTAGTVGSIGAGAGAGAGGAGTLPSTTLPGSSTLGGSGLSSSGVPGGASGSGMGGNVGYRDLAKKFYDGYKKYDEYKGYYDEGKGVYDDIQGNPQGGGGNRTAQDIGDAAGGAAAGRATGREREAAIQQQQDRINLQRSQLEQQQAAARNAFTLDSAQTDLSQRNFGLAAPGKRASNAVRGDILSRAQDVSFGNLGPNMHVPTINGGLRPSMFSDATRQLGTNMTNQALAGQEAGDSFAPLAYQAPAPIPDLTPLPQAGATDKILETAGYVSTGKDIWDRWLASRKPKPSPQAAVDPTFVPSGPTQDEDPSKVRGLA